MYLPNFCLECGERRTRRGWRLWLNPRFCSDCTRRLGRGWVKPTIMIALMAVAAFAAGRFLRPSPPPLIVQRLANSPLSDLSRSSTDAVKTTPVKETTVPTSSADEPGYICGARTKKGTPCHRRVHVAGERCFQHKGMPSLLPESKLVVRP
jgi:hypothetical protein